jgi:phosphoribosylformimino-5-aminoimidazole carboxamide ribotide isomerase
VHAVVLGTAAVEKLALVSEACRLFPGRVCVAVDVRAGKVAVGGWAAGSTLAAFEVGWRAKQAGASWIEYTDVARDGGFTGVDHAGAAQLQKDSGLPVIAAGGVKDLGDVRRCRDAGLAGVIVGKALYEGKLSLAEAVALGRGP